ncbi:ATP-binding protein [Streptomyces oceani]|uniref:Histidine kinase/HSP90-like ATPase domain-containing protein n=1 Tax=Streptomyces oceani TaxID=1075402 RepID=A0A1E7KFE7_9ACTN|nr:ATP-binding protein [Streptomyces oceani]OEV02625.1 hypothetical protein AN216_14000 [Streptomyces oceani]
MTAELPSPRVIQHRPHDESARRAQFRMRFSSTARGARLARRLTTVRLDEWGVPYDSDASHTAALIVGELATNATVHGHTSGQDFALSLSLTTVEGTRVLRIEVSDTVGRAGLPETVTPPDPSVETGRGLLLISALARRWGSTERAHPTAAGGKTVWAELEVG